MDKLIRDLVATNDPTAKIRIAEGPEMPRLLGRKLVEEANEVLEVLMYHESVLASGEREGRLVRELVDVYETMDTIMRFYKLRARTMEMEIEHKFKTAGGFQQRRVMCDLPEGTRTDQALRLLVEDLVRELINVVKGLTDKEHNAHMLATLTERANRMGCLGTVA